jgi:hypothetical protein
VDPVHLLDELDDFALQQRDVPSSLAGNRHDEEDFGEVAESVENFAHHVFELFLAELVRVCADQNHGRVFGSRANRVEPVIDARVLFLGEIEHHQEHRASADEEIVRAKVNRLTSEIPQIERDCRIAHLPRADLHTVRRDVLSVDFACFLLVQECRLERVVLFLLSQRLLRPTAELVRKRGLADILFADKHDLDACAGTLQLAQCLKELENALCNAGTVNRLVERAVVRETVEHVQRVEARQFAHLPHRLRKLIVGDVESLELCQTRKLWRKRSKLVVGEVERLELRQQADFNRQRAKTAPAEIKLERAFDPTAEDDLLLCRQLGVGKREHRDVLQLEQALRKRSEWIGIEFEHVEIAAL